MTALDLGFSYWAIKAADMSGRLTSIIASLDVSDSPLLAVVWNSPSKAWRFDPRTAAHFLYDERNHDRSVSVDRPAAEQIARESLSVELPPEEELRRLCAEGLSRWDVENEPYGPRD